MFYKIHGGNGATFFFSAASFADWRKSLEFYQGVSFVAKIKKFLLTAAYPVFARKAKITKEAVASELDAFLPEGAEVAIGDHDSAMISPTRDKVIIHHHGRSYEKFAFGKSREGVTRELALYRRLQDSPPGHFVVSPLLRSEANEKFVHFEMAYAEPQGSADEVPLEAYAEFFDLEREPDMAWSALWAKLQLPMEISEADRQGITPVGLVHYDFKPWNVKRGKVPHFFDFESVSTGVPLEDFFNYTVDPALSFSSARECMREMRVKGCFENARKLLALQGISPEETGRYWRWYLCERYDSLIRSGKPEMAEKFLALSRLPLPAAKPLWLNALSLAGVILLGLLLRLYYAAMHPLESRDAAGYLLMIRRVVHEGWGDFLRVRPPLFFYLTRALMRCGLDVETAALSVNIAAGTLLLIPLYLAGRAVWRKHSAGIAAAALGAVMPNLVKFSCAALREGVYLHFTVWSIALWSMAIRAGEKANRWKYAWSFLCGIAIAAGSLSRYEAALFLPFAAGALFLVSLIRRQVKEAFAMPLCLFTGMFCGLFLLTSLPEMPDVIGIYLNRIRESFWYWKCWGLR